MSRPRSPRLFLSLVLLAAPFAAAASAQGPGFPPPPVPPENQITAAKTNLGKVLFWDEQLSASGTVACATCHAMEFGGGDPRTAGALHPGPDASFGTPDDIRGSRGVIGTANDLSYVTTALFGLREQVTSRKALPVINAAYSGLQMWDGRATGQFIDPVTNTVAIQNGGSLESQASGPPLNTMEMAHAGTTWSELAGKVAQVRPLALATNLPAALNTWIGSRSYPQLFQEAFGDTNVTARRILFAIATYERTLVSNQAPIDFFRQGNPAALTPNQQRGLQVFNGLGPRCNTCHNEPLFAGPGFFHLGVRPINEDLGRGAITGQPQDNGRFKVPSLRNVGLRAPYFHNGGKATLEEVVDFYARGGDFRTPQVNIQPFPLNAQDRNALVDFLRNGLTDPRVAQGQAPFDHPTLFTRSNRAPRLYGTGTAGSGGRIPRLVAIEPPVLGNPNFTVAMEQGLGGAPAFFLFDMASDPLGLQTILGARMWLGLSVALTALEIGGLQGSGDGNGWQSVGFAIPNDALLDGAAFYAQGFAIDPLAPQGLSATGGLEVRFFAGR
jgi:cytochrome c peroxidase